MPQGSTLRATTDARQAVNRCRLRASVRRASGQ